MKRARLLAAASGGGHWTQLLRVAPAFQDYEVAYVSTFEGHSEEVGDANLYIIPDASRMDVMPFAKIFWRAIKIMAKERPKIVFTTGSAPMLAFIILGRMMGSHTIWFDSIANTERLSSSGRIGRKLAHRCASQWPEVAERENVEHWGQVI